MTDLKKHSTARPAKCKECDEEFSALWGMTVIHALSGMGLCDECKKKAERASKVMTRPKPKDKPGESDNGTEAGPVQAKSN